MAPTAWTLFVFFGIPLTVGLLGVHRGASMCYEAYLRSGATTTAETEGLSRRKQALLGGLLLLGAGGLVAHSARWILRSV